MSGLCGWFGRGPASSAAEREVIAMMAEPLSRFDRGSVRNALARFGAVAVAGTNVDVYQDGHQLVAVWGRLDFADPELAALAQLRGIAHALAQGYTRNGVEILKSLAGSFSFAVLDGSRGEALLATDRIGSHPLCYSVAADRSTLVFGSTLDAFSALPGGTAEISRQAIYDYVYFHMVPGPRTIHAGCRRLLPGSMARWRNGELKVSSYWSMQYVEDEKRPMPELKEEFLALLRKCVLEASQSGTIGAFLSGGTDSSTIAGMIGIVTGAPARTYSIGFDAEGYDEMAYARIAARHFGTHHHEYYITPDDVVSSIPQIAAVHDQPFGNSSAVPAYYCAKLARDDGVNVLLGGDGGDELFGGNERYAKQYLYSVYSDLPPIVRKRLVEPLVFLVPEMGVAGKVQRYIKNASLPMPSRYDNYNLLERLGTGNVFSADFLATVEPQQPSLMMEQAYNAAQAQSLTNRMLALDLKYTLADNDLPKVMRSCELAGVEARFPLLSDSLVGFSARLPPALKVNRTQLRYFFKEALRDFLPGEIIAKTKHGFGLPFGPWFQAHHRLRQIALDSLAGLRRRRIVRPEFIDELISVHVESHVKYYGTMVWVLMMLEQWLTEHRASA